jgi:hypothetical protein
MPASCGSTTGPTAWPSGGAKYCLQDEASTDRYPSGGSNGKKEQHAWAVGVFGFEQLLGRGELPSWYGTGVTPPAGHDGYFVVQTTGVPSQVPGAGLRRPRAPVRGLIRRGTMAKRSVPAVERADPWHAPRNDVRIAPVTEPLEFTLVSRLRETLRDHAATERQLRTLGEQAQGWATALQGQIHASESRLRRLNDDPASPLSDIAGELRHVDTLRGEMIELSSLLADLEQRARELRTEWLLRQAGSTHEDGG